MCTRAQDKAIFNLQLTVYLYIKYRKSHCQIECILDEITVYLNTCIHFIGGKFHLLTTTEIYNKELLHLNDDQVVLYAFGNRSSLYKYKV